MILREGENLCLQGDLTHSFYIVKSGALTATSKDEQNGTQVLNFGPGSTFGELSLIAGEPMEYTVRAEEDCEIEVVPQSALHDTMKEQPIWLKSILAFLTQRNHIAQENKRKSDLITTFPSLLFVLSRVPAKDISLVALQETLRHRAIYKSTSPNILSLTDQAILTAFVKAACDKGELQSDGLVAVNSSDLIEQTKRTMHGMSLTPRNLETLLQKQLLKELPKEKYCANFDKLLNLLELNRIYPLLDKKLL